MTSTGNLEVSLSPSTPATQDVPRTSSYITYTKFDVTAGNSDASLGTVTIKRTGLGSYKDFDKIWIEDDNGTVIAKSKSITSSEEVVLTFSSYVLKAGSTATLAVVASHDTTNATTSDINTLSVTALSTGGNVTGTFPIT